MPQRADQAADMLRNRLFAGASTGYAPKPSFFSPGRGRPLSGGKLSFTSRLYLPEVCQ